jgi:hypothetical protein
MNKIKRHKNQFVDLGFRVGSIQEDIGKRGLGEGVPEIGKSMQN